MNAAAVTVLFSILFPVKGWVASNQPINIDVRTDAPVTLMLTDFTGKPLDAQGNVEVTKGQAIDIRPLFNEFSVPGTYVLYAVPKGMDATKFVGTSVILSVLPLIPIEKFLGRSQSMLPPNP